MLIHDFSKLSKLEQTLTLHKSMMEFSGKWWQSKGGSGSNSISCLWGMGNST